MNPAHTKAREVSRSILEVQVENLLVNILCIGFCRMKKSLLSRTGKRSKAEEGNEIPLMTGLRMVRPRREQRRV